MMSYRPRAGLDVMLSDQARGDGLVGLDQRAFRLVVKNRLPSAC